MIKHLEFLDPKLKELRQKTYSSLYKLKSKDFNGMCQKCKNYARQFGSIITHHNVSCEYYDDEIYNSYFYVYSLENTYTYKKIQVNFLDKEHHQDLIITHHKPTILQEDLDREIFKMMPVYDGCHESFDQKKLIEEIYKRNEDILKKVFYSGFIATFPVTKKEYSFKETEVIIVGTNVYNIIKNDHISILETYSSVLDVIEENANK